MKNKFWDKYIVVFSMAFTVIFLQVCALGQEQKENKLLFSLDFDKKDFTSLQERGQVAYSEGIEEKGLDLVGSRAIPKLSGTKIDWFSNSRDFSVSLWVKSDKKISDPAIIISNADFSLKDAGIYGKRRTNKGITLYSVAGAWGWNIGNGGLHYNYEPIETDQPIADNKWHHIAFTYNMKLKEVRLFYDGINKAIFHVGDLDERDFLSDLPLRIGGDEQVSPGYRSFPGVIDEFQVWGSVLSPEDIKAEYEKYFTAAVEPVLKTDTFTVVNWNIWHGGTHFTKAENGFDGIERITELIKKAGADIVLMQETYGAGSRISSSLGYYYYEASSTVGAVWGANLSVMSRFPIEDAYMVEKRGNYGNNYAFNNGGVKVRLTDQHSVMAFSNWYNGSKPEDLDAVLKTWSGLIANSDQVPIVTGGDFNSVSHLDDGEGKSGHSKLMAGAGFIDSFRELYPDVSKYPGYSNGGASSRIDYIYYKGKSIKAVESGPIVPNFKGKEDRTPGYPSDHLGVVTKFRIMGFGEQSQKGSGPVVRLKLDGNVRDDVGANHGRVSGEPFYATGITGQALDLTANVKDRYGVDLGKSKDLEFNKDRDFSVVVWVKTLPGADSGNAIITNQDWFAARREWPNEKGTKPSVGPGWTIATQSSGAWAWTISDGSVRFDYEPTAKRQPINDGKWHQLAFTIKRKTQEACLYYDYKKVATYFLSSLKGQESPLSTMVGTCNLGGNNEMFSFNGMIDEVSIWGRCLSEDEIRSLAGKLVPVKQLPPNEYVSKLKVMGFNIWHGGRERGEKIGVQRVINIIKEANPDVIGMVETYGSGPTIADALGYNLYMRGDNLSVMSRYPIGDTYDIYSLYFSGGAQIKLSPGQEIAFFPTWLNHLPSSEKELRQEGATAEAVITNEMKTRGREITTILEEIEPMLSRSNEVPVILAGDFNSASHEDWREDTAHLHDGWVMDWPESKIIVGKGLKEAYREVYPDAAKYPGYTFITNGVPSSRIDYIYYKGRDMQALDAEIISTHPQKFPSDHCAVTATLKLPPLK